MNDVDKLACDHWSYVQDVIVTANPDIDDKVLEQIGFHYRTAFIHGYKHAKEEFKLPLFEINPDTGERRRI